MKKSYAINKYSGTVYMEGKPSNTQCHASGQYGFQFEFRIEFSDAAKLDVNGFMTDRMKLMSKIQTHLERMKTIPSCELILDEIQKQIAAFLGSSPWDRMIIKLRANRGYPDEYYPFEVTYTK